MAEVTKLNNGTKYQEPPLYKVEVFCEETRLEHLLEVIQTGTPYPITYYKVVQL